MKAYRIIKFLDRHHDTAAFRVKSPTYAQVPAGYRSRSKRWLYGTHGGRGVQACMVYVELVELAMLMPIRGVLAERDGPLALPSIADRTLLPLPLLKASLKLLMAPAQGDWHPWVDQIPWPVASELIETRRRDDRGFTVSVVLPAPRQCLDGVRTSGVPTSVHGLDVVPPKEEENEKGREKGCDAGATAAAWAERDLDTILRCYPKRVNPGHAKGEIANALDRLSERRPPVGDPVQYLIERTNAFAASPKGCQGRFTPDPANWFRGEGYDDDPETWQLPDPNGVERLNGTGRRAITLAEMQAKGAL